MDSQYKLLSELLSDQAAFITSPKTSLANYWGGGIVSPAPQCLRACFGLESKLFRSRDKTFSVVRLSLNNDTQMEPAK